VAAAPGTRAGDLGLELEFGAGVQGLTRFMPGDLGLRQGDSWQGQKHGRHSA
jgi:hypothetical protein